MKFEEMTIEAFTKELASDSPAPGGGSVAALCGTLAAGLGVMVAALTVGREKYKDSWEKMEEALKAGEKLRTEFIKLMNEDTESFNIFMKALKMPKIRKSRKQPAGRPWRRRQKRRRKFRFARLKNAARQRSLHW